MRHASRRPSGQKYPYGGLLLDIYQEKRAVHDTPPQVTRSKMKPYYLWHGRSDIDQLHQLPRLGCEHCLKRVGRQAESCRAFDTTPRWGRITRSPEAYIFRADTLD